MNYKHLSLIMLTMTSSYPSVGLYITNLPSHNVWIRDHSSSPADHPHTYEYFSAKSSPSSFSYQIDDPIADYIHSSHQLTNTEPVTYTRRAISGSSSTWTETPTHGPNSRSLYRSMATQAPDMVQVTRMRRPVMINRYYYLAGDARAASSPSLFWYPFVYYDDYAGNVYTTPYEFDGTTFVQPANVLYPSTSYLTYSTYSKPVYVVNNAFNGFVGYIYENPKQYAYYTVNQPVGYVYDDSVKGLNYSHIIPSSAANIPGKVEKKPIETNLTKINIDPITDPGRRSSQDRASSEPASSLSSNIIHKQRPSFHNAFAVIFHKLDKEDVFDNGNE